LVPVLVPVFFSSKVSTALWRSGDPRVRLGGVAQDAPSSPSSGNFAPAVMKYWITPVSWQLGRSSLSAASWFSAIDR
jgi:hypothetical protein